ncbi:hypothetical protein QEN19_002627 [Hanseniaspora menglaensis]
MHTILFSIIIAVLTILAIIGCTKNIKVINSLEILTLDLSSIVKASVFPDIASEITSIPDYIKIGLMGYCTPDNCYRKQFAHFNIKNILASAIISDNSLSSLVSSEVDVVLPTKFTTYIKDINKIIDIFSILLLVWFCLAGLMFVFTIIAIIFMNSWVFTSIVVFFRSICFCLGVACSVVATVGLLFAKNRFNDSDSSDLGMSMIIGKAFLGVLWGAVACSLLDAIISTVMRFTPRRRRLEEPVVYNRWGYKV